MVFSYNWLQSFFKQKLPPAQKLAELLRAHLAEVEEIKKEIKEKVGAKTIRVNDKLTGKYNYSSIEKIKNRNFKIVSI